MEFMGKGELRCEWMYSWVASV